MTGKVNYKAETIYEILGLNKVNTRTLQAIDGNHYEAPTVAGGTAA